MFKQSKIAFAFLLMVTLFFELPNTSLASNRKPKWVSKRPVDNDYYIGIGKSNKKETNTDYIQAAKNNALADLISEISVQISSNSILTQLENNSGLKEKYEAQIQLKAKDNISDYEIVDTWENKDEYWVYYRLSKVDYQRKKREKLEHAKSLSKDFYEKAKEAESNFDINNALIYYIKAFEPIENHLNEDLSVFTFDGRIFLDNAIYQSIQDILSRIVIVPEKELFTIKTLSSENEDISVQVKLKTDLETQNISNVPVKFSLPNVRLPKQEDALTNSKGIAELKIRNSIQKGKNPVIKAEFDIESYFNETSDDNILKNIVLRNSIYPYTNINIEVKELFAYLESEENNPGDQNSVQYITQIYTEELSNFFSFTNDKEQADVIIKIESTITKGANLEKYNLHTVFLNSNISIINVKNNLTIFNDAINIKGMGSGSYRIAAKDAMLKARKQINNEVVPKIRKIKL